MSRPAPDAVRARAPDGAGCAPGGDRGGDAPVAACGLARHGRHERGGAGVRARCGVVGARRAGGCWCSRSRGARRVPASTLWFLAALALQAAALLAVARARGAETPYMAVKMTYLAAYPAGGAGGAGPGPRAGGGAGAARPGRGLGRGRRRGCRGGAPCRRIRRCPRRSCRRISSPRAPGRARTSRRPASSTWSRAATRPTGCIWR